MKNKFLIIFLIFILSLNSHYSAIAEEFNFNITELQISENGNIIKGINGGEVTTKDNNIIITANNFNYNKQTTLLEAKGNVKIIDKIADVTIESNEVFYLKDREEIYTKGVSKAFNGKHIQIDADQYFKYNKLTSLIEAKGNVILDDKNKNITINTNEIIYLINIEKISTLGKTNINIENKYNIDGNDFTLLRNEMLLSSNKKATLYDNHSNIYEADKFQYSINEEIIKAEKIEIKKYEKNNKSDTFFFQKGFFDLKANKFLGKDVNVIFHKTLFDNVENDPRIKGVSGYGNEFNTYLDKAVFTSCKKTDKCPPWKLRATNVKHDKVKKQIIYKNAWLDLYDFPIVYFPKFFHPDPSVKRQSGLLRPEIGDHGTLGDSIYLPYFFVLSENKDITIKPRLFNDNKLVLQNEYRQITKNSLTLIDSSITTGHDSNVLDKGDTRSHFFANSKIDLGLKKFISSHLEINYEKVSNDNYLKLFNFIKSPLLLKNNDALESTIKLDLSHENYDFTSSFEMYETLSGNNSDRYQYVLPSYNFSKSFNLKDMNGSFSFSSYGDNTLRETNISTSTLANDLNYTSYNYFFENGIKTNFEVFLKNINSIGKNNIKYKNSPQSELISAYNYNASLPLKRVNKNSINTLIPRLSFRLSPHEMKNNSSVDRRINVDNVFSSNRLSFGDSFETGESLTLGLNFVKEKINIKEQVAEIEQFLDFKLATVFRLKEEKDIPTNSTLNKKTSNIFGQVNLKPNKIVLLNYNFSLKNDLNSLEYNSINTKLDFGNLTTQFNFLEERGVVGKSNVIDNITEYKFDEYSSLSFGTRKNRELDLTEYYDLVYEYNNDCLIAEIKYRKDYYNDEDIKPKEELFFSITIVPFYTYSPDKITLNKDRID